MAVAQLVRNFLDFIELKPNDQKGPSFVPSLSES
jgi:hypothetical protein